MQGDRSITVDDAAGWQVGDEIVVTPTEPTTVGGPLGASRPPDDHQRRRHRIGLDRRLEYDHPAVTVRPGVTHRPRCST